MKSSRMMIFLFTAVLAFPFFAAAQTRRSLPLPGTRKAPAVPVLLITSNYQSPAILAAIARKKEKVPCILIPAVGDRKGQILYIPSRNRDILPIAEKDLGKFISFLDPGKIIVLGDELIVPEKYRPLSTDDRPSLNIVSQNWTYNALVLGNLLSIRDMHVQYLKAMKNNVTEPFRYGLRKVDPSEKSVKKEEKPVKPEKTVKKEEKPAEPEKSVKKEEKPAEPEKSVKKEEKPAEPEKSVKKDSGKTDEKNKK